jgi:hypothetical protein
MSNFLGDPDVIDPPGFDVAKAWKGCQDDRDAMLRVGREIAAAHFADPGCCTCPMCGAGYWAWGRRQRCKACQFEYETDWWSMYSYGVGKAHMQKQKGALAMKGLQDLHERRMTHPYYRYGFEHPVDSAYDIAFSRDPGERINWSEVIKDTP